MFNFYPHKVFEYFTKISSIPHGSFNTKKIADYLVSFAEERNLDYKRDNANNVIIFKKGSANKENLPPIILQGHTDMVCASQSEFDFINKSIELDTDGKYIFAKGTTLGADNGIAVAMMLALLDDDMQLPPLECVFTSDEEVGMLGANALDMSCLKGKRMLNVDSEVEGVFTVGCAGGVSCNIEYVVDRHHVSDNVYTFEINTLHGGHSGVEINSGYANGIKVAVDFLSQVSKQYPLELISFVGGAADNAIPKFIKCQFAISGEKCQHQLNEIATEIIESVKSSYNEPALDFVLSFEGEKDACPITRESTDMVLSLIDTLPNGVLAYEPSLENSVKTSCNIGVIKLEEDKLSLKMSLRSSVNAERDMLEASIKNTISIIGADCVFAGKYPAWEPKKDSYLTQIAVETYKNMYGKEPVVEVIHAGLECSVFSEKIADFDCVSIGPNLMDIHTPDEKVEIASVGRVYDYICKLLNNIK